MTHFNRLPSLFILACVLLLSAGCETTPTKPPVTDASTPEEKLQQLYRLARTSTTPKSEGYRLQAAEILLDMQRIEEAEKILADMQTSRLPPQGQASHRLLSAEAALANNRSELALALLNRGAKLFTAPDLKVRSAQLKADAYQLLNRPFARVQELASISAMLVDTQAIENREAIWASLMMIPTDVLQQIHSGLVQANLKGWVELALLSKANEYDLDRQLQALNRWSGLWPDHPAANSLPDELALLHTIAEEQPGKIALMLPLHGRNGAVGEAVRDGFLAAFYAAHGNRSRTPIIEVIDTSSGTHFLELYDMAIANGAEFIVGPLQKVNVQMLQSQPDLLVPTLALNYSSSPMPVTNLYQYGLSAEDEARQVAKKAWRRGYRNALVLTPNTGWGDRIAQSFAHQWQENDGTVLEIQQFSEDKAYSAAISELLNIDESEQRAKRIKDIIRSGVEFSPRRRTDMDFIFIVGTSKQARQIKPTLAFHFAGNVPVYATSHIYSGTPDPLRDRDLDGIIFCETPWMLETTPNPLKANIKHSLPAASDRLGRLYALGVDAYRLVPRIKQLALFSNSKIYGHTGLLAMEDSRIMRSLDWALIKSGLIRRIQ